MRIMIAGGSGLIGRELTLASVTAGDEVIILSRNPSRVKGLPPAVQVVKWDGKSIQDWVQFVENSDAIVNLTGENLSGDGFFPARWTVERKKSLRESRVEAGQVICKAIELASRRPSVLIQASGIGYYGTQQVKALTEEDVAGADFLANLSLDWEASTKPVESMGVRRAIIRNGVVLSTQGGALTRLLLPYRLFVGGPIGNGRQIYSWIHIEDEVNAIRFLIQDAQLKDAFNLTAPYPVSNAEFGRTIARVIKRPYYLPLPAFAMNLAFGEVASVVIEGQTVLPNKLQLAGYSFKYPLLEGALKDLLEK
jgi:uncharacterized protein